MRRFARWLHAVVLGAGCTANPGAEIDEDILPPRELAEVANERAPVELTAADGTTLALVAYEANAEVEGPLALTELHLAFDNRDDRRIEGRFAIELPPRASLARLAMKIGGAWQEGEVVERQTARVAYESALHRRVDPALLEHDSGNVFTARVFPIEARERKEIIVAYVQELPDPIAGYRLPLVGLPTLPQLDATVRVHYDDGEIEPFELHERDYQPTEDLVAAAGPTASALRREDLALARVRIPGDDEPVAIDDLLVLFDTSASQALGFDRRIVQLRALLGELDGDTRLRLVAFDQRAVELYRGPIAALDHAPFAKLATRRALGASDLAGALRFAAERVVPGSRVLLVSDGIATAGGTELVELERAASELGRAGALRIDAIADATDEGTLAALTTAPGLDAGVVIDAGASDALRRLRTRAYEELAVEVPGARWVWPERFTGVQPGDAVLVYADLPEDAPLSILLGDSEIVPPDAHASALLERAWIGAYLERLQHQRSRLLPTDTRGRDALRRMIVDVSMRHRVLTELTALLVLESDIEYRNFGIERRGPADAIPRLARNFDPEMMARNAGILGHVQQESGAFLASPYGSAFSVGNDDEDVWGNLVGYDEWSEPYPRELPKVERGLILAVGGIDRSALRYFVDVHADHVRGCHAHVLQRDERLRGTVTLALLVSAGGRVAHASVADDTVHDAELAKCITTRIARDRLDAARSGTPTRVFVQYRLGGTRATAFTPSADDWARLELDVAAARELDLAAERTALVSIMRGATEVAHQRDRTARLEAEEKRTAGTPWEGRLFDVMKAIDDGETQRAIELAFAWHDEAPGEALALVAIGEAAEAAGDPGVAARAYGSIIDLYPSRAELRRHAAARLERIGGDALRLAIDSYRVALASRRDHPASHRGLAMALVKHGELGEAARVLQSALHEPAILWDRFAESQTVLREDLALVAAAWRAADPRAAAEIDALLAPDQLAPADAPSLRFVLTWETDANDVDFHVHDGLGGHASYRDEVLPSGGRLYADITTGFGPECFAIEGTPTAFPYELRAHYFSRGPMGWGMGRLQVLQHDGHGKLAFIERPFVVMKEGAWVQLGALTESLI